METTTTQNPSAQRANRDYRGHGQAKANEDRLKAEEAILEMGANITTLLDRIDGVEIEVNGVLMKDPVTADFDALSFLSFAADVLKMFLEKEDREGITAKGCRDRIAVAHGLLAQCFSPQFEALMESETGKRLIKMYGSSAEIPEEMKFARAAAEMQLLGTSNGSTGKNGTTTPPAPAPKGSIIEANSYMLLDEKGVWDRVATIPKSEVDANPADWEISNHREGKAAKRKKSSSAITQSTPDSASSGAGNGAPTTNPAGGDAIPAPSPATPAADPAATTPSDEPKGGFGGWVRKHVSIG